MIRLRTFGGVDLRGADGRELRPILVQPKRFALLTYVALAGPSGYRRRDTTLALFWPDLDGEHGRGALRQALRFLRRVLGDGVIVTRGEQEIGVDHARLACDAVAFARECDAGRSVDALALYRGDLLDGLYVADAGPEFERWLEEERVSLRRRAAEAIWRCAEERRTGGARSEAATFARWAASLAPADEGGLTRLIAFLDQLGDRAGALNAYEEFARRLQQDFEAAPSPETQALVRSVRARTQPEPALGSPAGRDGRAPLSTPAAVRAPRRLPVVLSVAALVVATVVVVSQGRSPSIRSIAVLPLQTLRPDSAVEYLADGITESVIHSLSRTPRLRVLAPSTVFRYKGAAVEPREAGRTLGVDAVLRWEAEELGDRLVIRTELVRTADGAELWSGRYVRPAAGLLAMPEEIAEQVVDGLQLRLTGEDRPRAAGGHTADLEAFRLYLRGRYAWNRRDEEGTWVAIRSFDLAVARDPTFALAWAGLANAYIILGHQSLVPSEEAYPRARAAALRALEIDSTLAEAHAALGVVLGRYDWQWLAKIAELERAIALNPSYPTAHQWYAVGLEIIGRNDQAIASVRRAHELDPLSPMTGTSVGLRLYYARRYGEAVAQYRMVLQFDPRFTQAHIGLGWALLEQGDYRAALGEFQQALDLTGGRQGLQPLAVATARAGRTSEARRLLARLHVLSGEHYVSPAALAEIYVALGEPDSAFAWLATARRRRADEICLLLNNPRLDPLRSDPRFGALLREVGLDASLRHR